jgi:hypothetical protein
MDVCGKANRDQLDWSRESLTEALNIVKGSPAISVTDINTKLHSRN